MEKNIIKMQLKVNLVYSSIVIIPASKFSHSSFNLSILSVTMGLLNYGAFYDKVEKGLYGSIMINNHDITVGNWAHQIGLQGEYKNVSYFLNALVSPQSWYS